jgi:hypothetical protein
MQYAGDRKCLVSLKSVRLVFNEICPGTLVTEERRARQPYGGKKNLSGMVVNLPKGKLTVLSSKKRQPILIFPVMLYSVVFELNELIFLKYVKIIYLA